MISMVHVPNGTYEDSLKATLYTIIFIHKKINREDYERLLVGIMRYFNQVVHRS